MANKNSQKFRSPDRGWLLLSPAHVFLHMPGRRHDLGGQLWESGCSGHLAALSLASCVTVGKRLTPQQRGALSVRGASTSLETLWGQRRHAGRTRDSVWGTARAVTAQLRASGWSHGHEQRGRKCGFSFKDWNRGMYTLATPCMGWIFAIGLPPLFGLLCMIFLKLVLCITDCLHLCQTCSLFLMNSLFL